MSDTQGSLMCFQRDGTELVPGCNGPGRSSRDYCYDPNPGGNDPTPAPAGTTSAPGTITYVPGEATVFENGLLLSTGLKSRIIATKNTRVQYDTGGQSSVDFHTAPDGM